MRSKVKKEEMTGSRVKERNQTTQANDVVDQYIGALNPG
jgi:hypothetical protein